MPRFQVSDGGTQKYWEIACRGTQLRRWWGRQGTQGNAKANSYDSPERARAAYRKHIADKERAGYRRVGREPIEPPDATLATHPELEAAIAAAPDDSEAYQVYGDWLIGQDDPRGELICLQVALHRLQATAMPSEPQAATAHRAQFVKHRKAVQAILDTHRDHLLGDAALVASGPADSASPLRRRGLVRLSWRWGFVERVQLEAGDYPPEGPLGVLSSLAAHPSGRFIRALSVHLSFDGSLGPAVDLLLDPRALPLLTELDLGCDADAGGEGVSLGEVGALLERRPRIDSLRLCGRCTAASAPVGGQLRRLALRPIGDARPWLTTLERPGFAALERLELCFTETGQAPDWHRLWHPRLEGLRELVLAGVGHHDAALHALLGSPLAIQLESLSLQGGRCSPATLDALVAAADDLPLRSLELANVVPPPRDPDALRAAFPRVRIT